MIDWSVVDTVLLDMDGTLLDLHFDNYFWLQHLPLRYGQKHGIDTEQAKQILQQKYAEIKGTLNWYCVEHWQNALAMDICQLKLEVSHLIATRPYTEEFLQQLSSLQKATLIVTNAHPKVLSLKLGITGLDKKVDRVISSHDYHIAKENPGFWHLLEEKQHINLERCVLIDDDPNVLKCAQQEGIKQLFQILAPDSKQETKKSTEFPSIVDFKQIILDSVVGRPKDT